MSFYPTIDTIRFGARLLATAQDVDPATLEKIGNQSRTPWRSKPLEGGASERRQRRWRQPMVIEVLARFWAKVDKNGPDGCWIWKGAATPAGYGQLASGGTKHNRPVLSLATHIALGIDGRFRPGNDYVAMHRCDNPRCVNPSHLRWGTFQENTDDCRKKGRMAHQRRREADPATAEWHPASGARQPRLTPETVRLIRESVYGGARLAKQVGVSTETIRNIRSRRTYKDV